MPTITNRILNLTKEGTNIKIDVNYDVNFSRLESNLTGLGMTFRELVEVLGVDPPGSTTGTFLNVGPVGIGKLPVVAKNDSQTLHRHHTITVPRSSLNEDPGTFIPDDDEIRCRIRVLSIGIPNSSVDAFTNEQVLLEDGGIHA